MPHFNINSIRNKFHQRADSITVKGNIDLLIKSKSKIDDSFYDSHFFLDGHGTRYKLD